MNIITQTIDDLWVLVTLKSNYWCICDHVCTFNRCKRRSEIVQVMKEDLVAVGAGRDTRYVTIGFIAYPFRRVGLLKQLKHTSTTSD